jgi:hypothetical protein
MLRRLQAWQAPPDNTALLLAFLLGQSVAVSYTKMLAAGPQQLNCS